MTNTQALVFDTTCLSHFARAERLDVLGDLVLGRPCYTTQIVREELRTGLRTHSLLGEALDVEWLSVLPLDTVDELNRFAKWVRRLGAGPRHLGESSVFTAAELLDAVAITDDREAVRVGRAYDLAVHGTVWLLASACRAGKLTEASAGNLIDTLRATDMRLPCTGPEFGSYCKRFGLL